MPYDTEMRTCWKCNTAYPKTSDFFGHTPSFNLRGVCKACERVRMKAHEAANKPKRKERDAKRDAAQGGRRSGADPLVKRALFNQQAGICPCCFQKIGRLDEAQVDHMQPLSKGGADVLGNLALTHSRCNKDKHNKSIAEHWAWRVNTGQDAVNLGVKYSISATDPDFLNKIAQLATTSALRGARDDSNNL